uniref:Uncharacterized protein n=1 Tax=viral metagenome TaxID=1070528 RepID=A0A6M3IEG4_9ZZZZ
MTEKEISVLLDGLRYLLNFGFLGTNGIREVNKMLRVMEREAQRIIKEKWEKDTKGERK